MIVDGAGATKVIGYITLVCSQVHMDAAPEDEDFPAIKIARLAVDRRHRGKDLGTKLVAWAIAKTTECIIPHVGCRFLILDAKQKSIPFYLKQGFVLLDTARNRAQDNPVMFMDIGRLTVG